MNGTDGPLATVGDEYRNAVGDRDRDGLRRIRRNQRVSCVAWGARVFPGDVKHITAMHLSHTRERCPIHTQQVRKRGYAVGGLAAGAEPAGRKGVSCVRRERVSCQDAAGSVVNPRKAIGNRRGRLQRRCARSVNWSRHLASGFPLQGIRKSDKPRSYRQLARRLSCERYGARFALRSDTGARPTEANDMTIKFFPNDKGNPPGKLAEAELHFSGGPLDGLKLVGFSVWERKTGGRNVTVPSRQYSVNGERRSFALLRPIVDASSQDRLRDLILDAYKEHEAARAEAS